MCGRYVRRSDKQHIAERFRLGKIPEGFPLPPDWNIAPTTAQPVIRASREDGSRELELMRWGLLPFFAKTPQDFKAISTINARAETVATAPTFREPFKRKRCLVPVDAFYEWKALSSAKGARKQPFAFSMRSGEPFAFAGLWDAWREPKKSPQAHDTWLQSFTVITTDANELMSTVHTRMPVILPERDWEMWLDRDFGSDPTEIAQLKALLRPFDSDAMTAAPANQAVGNVKNNGPEMLIPNLPEPALPIASEEVKSQ